jgi:peptidoglycan/xylan/chitin deacetylase (PgdA/CDA1 family)
LKKNEHYLGAHSDQHLLYCAWEKRDSLLVSKNEFTIDLQKNYAELAKFGVKKEHTRYFLPPYEWYNDTIAKWTSELGLRLINFTLGTRSTADYTWPELKNYRSSEEIYKSIMDFEKGRPSGLNGFILLIHIGTDPRRTDKFYHRLPELLTTLRKEGYSFKVIDEMLD